VPSPTPAFTEHRPAGSLPIETTISAISPAVMTLPQAFLHIVARFLLEEEPLLAYISYGGLALAVHSVIGKPSIRWAGKPEGLDLNGKVAGMLCGNHIINCSISKRNDVLLCFTGILRW